MAAAFSLFALGTFGRIVGIVAATFGAIGALLNIGGAHPWWALGVFAGGGLFPTVFVAFVGAVIVIVAQRKVWAHA